MFLPEHLDYATLKQENVSFISEDLRKYFSDIIYSCTWKGKRALHFSFLLEHKSFVPANIYIQLQRYLTEGYEYQFKNRKGKLTLIIPCGLSWKRQMEEKEFCRLF